MIITLVVLLAALALFISGKIRMDLVALMVLSCLAASGLVTPAEALSGFSSTAVVTVWAVFILSGGLTRTGVANALGRQVMRLAGESETRLLLVLLPIAALMSSVMNSIGVIAMFLPVVMDILRQTRRSPSRILLPLVQAILLGSTLTLISTPPNILSNEVLFKLGFQPFNIFDFTPMGIPVTLVGIVFILLVGRRLLPHVDIKQSIREEGSPDLQNLYDLGERMFILRLAYTSALSGKTLAQSRLGSALGFNVVAILRGEQKLLAPQPETVLSLGDRLLAIGRLEQLRELINWQQLFLVSESISASQLVSDQIEVIEVKLSPHSQFLGQTIGGVNFRKRFGFNVLGIRRDGIPRRTNLVNLPLQPEDVILIQAAHAQVQELHASGDFVILGPRQPGSYRLAERLFEIRIPETSALAGKTLVESRLGQAFGLNVVGIVRGAALHLLPAADEVLLAEDALIVEGKREDMEVLSGLQELEVDESLAPDVQWLDSEEYALVEVMLHPRANLAGRSLRDLNFREKYGLNVLAIWSGGRAYRSNLFNHSLRFGDALLVYGRREKVNLLGRSRDFMVLSQENQEPPLYRKAALAGWIMVGVLLAALTGWLPISVAAVLGATLMLLSGCLTMNEAYGFIEWRAIFLIAGMLPMGIAMEKSGLALYITRGVVEFAGAYGVTAILAGFFLITSLAVQVMPAAAVVVLIAPLAVNTAQHFGFSPYPFVMIVTVAASTNFLLPVSHAATLLVMGPGGYRTSDYFKSGLPLVLAVMVTALLVVPAVFPLR